MAAGRDGVVWAVFDAQERFTAACDDAVPQEMICGETTRIDQTALTGLIERSEGLAVGTPRSGLPILVVDEPVVEVTSRARDVLIGGFLSLLVMAAWYCATQL